MRAQELIQAILRLIDQPQEEPEVVISVEKDDSESDFYNDEIRRFKQIAGLQDPGEMSPLSNAPNPQYAPVSAVTTDAGGGPNEPKHPADIRTAQTSMYPNHLHNPREE